MRTGAHTSENPSPVTPWATAPSATNSAVISWRQLARRR